MKSGARGRDSQPARFDYLMFNSTPRTALAHPCTSRVNRQIVQTGSRSSSSIRSPQSNFQSYIPTSFLLISNHKKILPKQDKGNTRLVVSNRNQETKKDQSPEGKEHRKDNGPSTFRSKSNDPNTTTRLTPNSSKRHIHHSGPTGSSQTHSLSMAKHRRPAERYAMDLSTPGTVRIRRRDALFLPGASG